MSKCGGIDLAVLRPRLPSHVGRYFFGLIPLCGLRIRVRVYGALHFWAPWQLLRPSRRTSIFS
jgi:hypothetical protein